MMEVSSWTVGHILKTWRGNGAVEISFESRTAQMSALFHIFMCAFSSEISFIVLLMLPSPSLAVLLKVLNDVSQNILDLFKYNKMLRSAICSTLPWFLCVLID